MSKIVIIGAGAMGSAFALPCLDNNHDINIVGTHLENNFIDNLQKNNNFLVPFLDPFFEVLELLGCLLGAFLGLLRLSWEASRVKKCRQSYAKTTFL